jgi:hypothetical protein
MIAPRLKPLARVVAILALLAACASGAPDPVTARFNPEGTIIVVTVSDPQPARAVDLVSPTGAVTKAASVTTDEASFPSAVGNPSTGIAFGYPSGYGGTGIGAANWGSGFGGGGFGSGGRVTSSAIIVVDHPGDYQKNRRDYRILVDLCDPSNGHRVILDAPEPLLQPSVMPNGP